MSFLTNGFLKSSIHRVVSPPADQEHLDRIGVLYFVRPEDKLPLIPVDSPLLKRLGLESSEDGEIVTAGEWVKARVAENVSGRKNGVIDAGDHEIIKGKKTKYYD
jgi:isopenicillin N synthase-like dioxygenase